MNITENKDLARHYFNVIRAKVDNKRGLEIHAAYLDGLCLLKTFYRLTLDDPPPLSDKSILFFMSGLCVEDWLAPTKQEPKERDGIIGSVDGFTPDGELLEIKSTRKGLNLFDPAKSYPWWITRLKTYCSIHERNVINLLVFFWVGDRKAEPIAMRAYRFEFTDGEIGENWFRVSHRANVLAAALHDNEPIPMHEIEVQEWEHRDCEFAPICYYLQNGGNHNGNEIEDI